MEGGEGSEKREEGCWLRRGSTSPCTTPRGCQLLSAEVQLSTLNSSNPPLTPPVQGPWLDDEKMPKGGKDGEGTCRTHKARTGPHLSLFLPCHPGQHTHPPSSGPQNQASYYYYHHHPGLLDSPFENMGTSSFPGRAPAKAHLDCCLCC